MTLIDTSAWIEFFRRKGDPLLKGRPNAESLAWQELCHGLLASNQFIFRL